MLSRDYNQQAFLRHFHNKDVGVVEGVMGLFDGYDGKSEAGSTAEMAKWLGLSVILVVDASTNLLPLLRIISTLLRFCRCPKSKVQDSQTDNWQVRSRVRFGVARDEAFCFYYLDNLELLEAAGVELVFFSPLRDVHLPENLRGLYFGGGYPEVHAAKLSANTVMRQEIKKPLSSRDEWCTPSVVDLCT